MSTQFMEKFSSKVKIRSSGGNPPSPKPIEITGFLLEFTPYLSERPSAKTRIGIRGRNDKKDVISQLRETTSVGSRAGRPIGPEVLKVYERTGKTDAAIRSWI